MTHRSAGCLWTTETLLSWKRHRIAHSSGACWRLSATRWLATESDKAWTTAIPTENIGSAWKGPPVVLTSCGKMVSMCGKCTSHGTSTPVFEKCKIARETKSDVILHILSLYNAPSLFCLVSPWPYHSRNPGAAVACTETNQKSVLHLFLYDVLIRVGHKLRWISQQAKQALPGGEGQSWNKSISMCRICCVQNTASFSMPTKSCFRRRRRLHYISIMSLLLFCCCCRNVDTIISLGFSPISQPFIYMYSY